MVLCVYNTNTLLRFENAYNKTQTELLEVDKMKFGGRLNLCVAYKGQTHFAYVHFNKWLWDTYYEAGTPLSTWKQRLIRSSPELVLFLYN